MHMDLSAVRRNPWVVRAGIITFLAVGLVDCALTSDFSTYDPVATGTRPTHVVGGTIAGTGAGLKVTLALNGTEAEYQDGTFAFSDVRVPEGDAYEVTVGATPQQVTCSVANGTGTMGRNDVTDVNVSCVSDDATLTALSLDQGTIAQTDKPTLGFATGVTSYFTWVYSASVAAVYGARVDTTKFKATASRSDATIKIGTSSAKGSIEAQVAVPDGKATTDVVVTSSSGKTKTYSVEVRRAGSTTFDEGFATALSGDLIATGKWTDSSAAKGIDGNELDTSASGAGAVRLFRRTASGGWAQEAYVKASNTQSLQWFGKAVALEGDTLVVGAPFEGSASNGINGSQSYDCNASVNCNLGAGAVYIFERKNGAWGQTAYVKSVSGLLGAFGTSVAIAGDLVAIGQPGDQYGYGAVVVLKRTNGTWSETGRVVLPSGTITDFFGRNVALTADTLVASAPSDFSVPLSGQISGPAGKVAVFKLANGVPTYEATLTAGTPRSGSVFGSSVTVNGTTIVVGAEGEYSNATGINGNQLGTGAPSSGAAYVFTKPSTTWVQQAYLKASNSRANAWFGTSVHLDGDVLAVGSPGESSGTNSPSDTSCARSGAVYLFQRTGSTWSEKAYLKSAQASVGWEFGSSVALSGQRLGSGGGSLKAWVLY